MKTFPLLCALLLTLLVGGASPSAQTHADKKIKVLIVTGGHQFKADAFYKMFADNPEITYTAAVQHDAGRASSRKTRV